MSDLAGILFIGDPHLASRVPGFRKDDYPRTMLDKLKWAMRYAADERLLPVILGDLFDYPRDNANWLLVELLSLFNSQTLVLWGNHDCKENSITPDDTISILLASGCVRLLDGECPWIGSIGGCTVCIGGSCWGQRLPKHFDRSSLPAGRTSWVFWAAHHDLRFPGYEESARLDCRDIPGIDAVINGHIHRDLGQVVSGGTRWINPGNIARIARSDATKAHVPGVLRIDVSPDVWTARRITVPHQPFDDVFHAELATAELPPDESVFINGLAELESLRTASGAGLQQFLDANLPQFDGRVAEEIRRLAKEVLNHGE